MRRTEQGKSLRKAYESHEIKHGFNEFREVVPRNDGMTNTISTVQKDNLLIERERERRNSPSTSPLINREKSTEQTALWQEKIEESQISNRLVPVLLSKQATKFERIIEICGTLMARDYKGFGNQDMCGVITYEEKHK